MVFIPLSLDIETSTSDPNTGTILSLGIIRFDTGETKYWNIRHELLSVSPQAMAVNQIPVTELNSPERKTLFTVDKEFREFVASIKPLRCIPMGMNVGSFDMSFVHKYLPKAANDIGYRSLDLNSLIFARANPDKKDFMDVKRRVQKAAYEFAKQRAPDLSKHHALFDCYMNCYVFYELTGERPEWFGPINPVAI